VKCRLLALFYFAGRSTSLNRMPDRISIFSNWRPFGVGTAEALDAKPAGQASFDRGFDRSRREDAFAMTSDA
jgi:hypothetical protein